MRRLSRMTDYKAWWEGLDGKLRTYTRRAAKKGIEIHRQLSIMTLPQASGQFTMRNRFVKAGSSRHYGKNFDTVKRENSTYLDRSEFLGAYYSGELVGFMKFVYVGDTAQIMQILSLKTHQDKRPLLPLIARAVEICHKKGLKYLIWGKFTYGRKTDSGIADFKRHLGFNKRISRVTMFLYPVAWPDRPQTRSA